MDRLAEHDAVINEQTPPEEKLAQALELMETGIAWKRAALARAHPSADPETIDALLQQWLFCDD